jgi:hypothetical protein
MKQVRHLAFAILPVALLATGCGGHGLQAVSTGAQIKSPHHVAAKAVAPDDPGILADDLRKANYWAEKFSGSANLVMSIQTTALNSQKVSSAANVFFCPEAYYASKPCVFVTRHYLSKYIGFDTEMVDFNRFASKLKTIGPYDVKAPAAWSNAHGWQPAAICPTTGPCPAPAAAAAGKLFFSSSRAFLTQGDSTATWSLYADKQKFAIDAKSGVVSAPVPQIDPNDKLNEGYEPDSQRAAAVWLPTSPFEANIQTDPS